MGFWRIAICAYSVMAFVNLPVQLSKTPVKGPVRQVMSCAPKQVCYNHDGRTFPISNPLSRWRLLCFKETAAAFLSLGAIEEKTCSVMGMGAKALGICLAEKTLRDREGKVRTRIPRKPVWKLQITGEKKRGREIGLYNLQGHLPSAMIL